MWRNVPQNTAEGANKPTIAKKKKKIDEGRGESKMEVLEEGVEIGGDGETPSPTEAESVSERRTDRTKRGIGKMEELD